MTAAEARLRTSNATNKQDCEREIRIRTALNKIFREIQEVAAEGQSQMLFSVSGLKFDGEVQEVRRRLLDLGYVLSQDSDNGLRFTMIQW